MLIVALLAGCGDHAEPVADDTRAPAAPAPAEATLAAAIDAGPPVLQRLQEPPSGAVTPWRAVLERTRLLRRRQQHGVIHGRVSSHDGRRYLIDASVGAGSLAAQLAGLSSSIADGARIAAWGAWAGDRARGWRWFVTKVAELPPSAADDSPYHAHRPGHHLEEIARPPKGAMVIESLPRGGGGIFFQVIRGPKRPGDGWLVAGRSHWPGFAILLLPGEDTVYGGQDMRSAAETWQLQPKQSYVVRVRRYRPGKAGKLPILYALSPPKRVSAK